MQVTSEGKTGGWRFGAISLGSRPAGVRSTRHGLTAAGRRPLPWPLAKRQRLPISG